MSAKLENLKKWINDMATLIERSEHPDPEHYSHFLQEPEHALCLVNLINSLEDSAVEAERPYYSACILALDICIAQLQAASESNNKLASKTMQQLMSHISSAINTGKHSLSFWLPVLNAFYEVHAELSPDLKDAYFDLANHEDVPELEEELSHIHAIRDLIEELSDLSIFDIAENFFAQSYAMPTDFFTDLVLDLYSIEEGHDIALLTLLYPKQEVRENLIDLFDQIIENITLSPASLTRLQSIKHWYPASYYDTFERWIRTQRKKGVVFSKESHTPKIQIKASETDGTGAQGIFIHVQEKRKHRLCGLLLKQETGIKDAWITPTIPARDIARYYHESFDESVVLRNVDVSYLLMMTNHFLAITVEQGAVPDLHLLEIQEELGIQFLPQKLDIPYLIEQLAVEITPFTPDTIQKSLKRSKAWTHHKSFTESWYIENIQVDKLVNRCCNYIDGVKICRFEEAIAAVFAQEMELHRERWLFHFLWTSLWLKVKSHRHEKLWQDSFFIAYAIHSGVPLATIPIMHEICYQSVVNSIETMQERRTYLNQE